MPAPFDDSEFVDADFQPDRGKAPSPGADVKATRPPSREELDARMQETQQRLEELRRVQEQLQEERATLEEARRRRGEYHTGRAEMVEHLTRGVGLLEEAEFNARQQAEQMAKTLADLRDHLGQVQSLSDENWSQEHYAVELTRALTTLENARMEWNAARLKWTILSADPSEPCSQRSEGEPVFASGLSGLSFRQLCRLGLALTWPLTVAVLLAAVAFYVAWSLNLR